MPYQMDTSLSLFSVRCAICRLTLLTGSRARYYLSNSQGTRQPRNTCCVRGIIQLHLQCQTQHFSRPIHTERGLLSGRTSPLVCALALHGCTEGQYEHSSAACRPPRWYAVFLVSFPFRLDQNLSSVVLVVTVTCICAAVLFVNAIFFIMSELFFHRT
ncbi:hypothetical protein BJ170DRAFT_458024 [Xylariales sp. AK1849]|nr:hypothetical protein BJ170DRAFT_458024 [Xylariales sp. AK1849]